MGLVISGGFVLMVGFAIFALIIVVKGIRIVSQSDIVIIERLGKYHTTLTGGFNLIIPIIDSVKDVLSTKEQIIDINKQSVITKDNVNIAINGIVFCKIEDGVSATYKVNNYKLSIAALAQTTLRSVIGSMDLDQTLSSREIINAKLLTDLGAAVNNWGITITRVEISDIEVPQQIQMSMNKQMEAERNRRAIEIEAEAKKQALIKEAEAFKEKNRLEAEAIERMAEAKKIDVEKAAEAQANSIKSINNALKENKIAGEFMLAKDRIDAFGKLAASDSSNKMIVPFETSSMVGSMSIIGDYLLNKTTSK